MPGRDGLWLTDQVRRDYPDTAVIIATGVSDVAPAVEGLRQGVVDFLTKPFDRHRLLDAVARRSNGIAAALRLAAAGAKRSRREMREPPLAR